MCESRLLLSKERLLHNLTYIRSYLHNDTKILVNLKANAYGHGARLIGLFLQDKADYFSVACQKEGEDLRQAGIQTPLLVYNPPVDWNADFFASRLEPVLYDIEQAESLISFLKENRLTGIKVHVKLDTGMHRSGLMPGKANRMISLLKTNDRTELVSVFSHLAAADDPSEDDFTLHQLRVFRELSARFYEVNHRIIRHIANSSAVFRLPETRFDMVRPGLSVYGISPVEGKPDNMLKPVARWVTRITQIRRIKKGETVGYNRRFKAARDSIIALIPVGYGDGYKRTLGNGVGQVTVHGKRVPVIGKVNMDMLTLDVTDVEANTGDEVVLFGDAPRVKELARLAGTIPYEITASLTQRVKRMWQTF